MRELLLVWLQLLKSFFGFNGSISSLGWLEIFWPNLLQSTISFRPSHIIWLLSALMTSLARLRFLSFYYSLEIGQRSLRHLEAKFKKIRSLVLCQLYWVCIFHIISRHLILSFLRNRLPLQPVWWLFANSRDNIVLRRAKVIFDVPLFDCWVLLNLKWKKRSFNSWDR